MLSEILDLTYYTPVIRRDDLKKNGSTRFIHTFTLPKKLLKDNNIDEPLPYYRLGNWKTKEIFKAGKLTKSINTLTPQYTKNIPISMVNRLQIEKHDILRLRLQDDIIWIEKIDNVTLKDINSLEHRFITNVVSRKNNFNNEHMGLVIPISIIDKLNNKETRPVAKVKIDLLISGKRFNNIELPIYKNSTSILLYITKEMKKESEIKNGKCLCSFKDKTLTIEKFLG